MRNLLLATLLTAGGCYVNDGTQPQYAAQGQPEYADPGVAQEDEQADLVEVNPGVEVVADYDYPVFYADNWYWWNRGGIWYRSGYYGGGWQRSAWVSPRVTGIRNPGGYAHFRPNGYVRRGSGVRYSASVHGGGGSYRARAAVRSSPRGGGSRGGHHR